MGKGNRSGGPRTAAGKLVASKNSLRLGVYSKQILLPNESAEEFENFCQEYLNDLKPQDIVGRNFVLDMAGEMWKLMRVNQVETAALRNRLAAPLKKEELAGTKFLWRDSIQAVLEKIPALNVEEIPAIVSALSFYDNIKDMAMTPELWAKIEKEHPILYELLVFRMPQALIVDDSKKINEAMTQVDITGKEDSSFKEKLEAAVAELKERLIFLAHKHEILAELSVIKDARTLDFIERVSQNRAQAFVRKQYANLLAQYRRHEEWRQDQRTIDITP